jgi:YHS domain-containing protein
MNRSSRFGLTVIVLVTMAGWGSAGSTSGGEAEPRNIPAPFAPLEYLVGRWNGHGIPKDNPAKQFRGWDETHTWAWMFAKGQPVGLSVSIAGGKVLTSAKLTYDTARQLYRLEGAQPAPLGTISFEGTLDRSGKYLVLDHNVAGGKSGKSAAKIRLSLWPNANFIRYTMAHELREPGSTQFTRLMEIGLTRDGESLAASAASSTSDLAKCIVTGGAATTTVSYQGRTFPVCCSGCRDEFNENPEKYLKKASLFEAAKAAKSGAGGSTARGVSRFEDAFAGDVDASASKAKPVPPGSSATVTKADRADEPTPGGSETAATKASSKKVDDRSAAEKDASRAASLLKLGQNLEKSAKTSVALDYYRKVVKDFAKTPAAKTAAERIRKLEKP